jgi:hypothetical protein
MTNVRQNRDAGDHVFNVIAIMSMKNRIKQLLTYKLYESEKGGGINTSTSVAPVKTIE